MSNLVEEKIKITSYSMFKDGELLDEADREDITEHSVFFPEGLAVGKVSLSRKFPIKLYAFGGNADTSIHISVPFPFTKDQMEEAMTFASNFCDAEIAKQRDQYTAFLTDSGIDWAKIEKNIK